MLTLKQLARYTSDDRKDRAKFVKVLKMKTGYHANGLGFVAAMTYSTHTINAEGYRVKNMSPNRYVVMFTFIDKKLHVHASCSCADNTFMHEFANAAKDASEIEYSNGEPPDIKNPTHRPGLCKHAYSLYLKIQPKLP